MLTPLDIQNKTFKKKMGGYERSDVDEFFSLIYDEYDKLYTENAALRDKVNALADAVKQYKTMEDTLQETLVIAQKTGEDVKAAATDRAGSIIEDANRRADDIIRKAAEDVRSYRNETIKLKSEFDACKARLLSIMQSEIALLSQADINLTETEEEN